MINDNISLILYIVAAITSVVVFQFFAPRFYAQNILKIELPNDASRFYFAHWGVLVGTLVILMLLAVNDEALRRPVILVTLIEKAVLAIWVFAEIKKPYTKKLIPAAIFDSVVCVVFGLYLLGY